MIMFGIVACGDTPAGSGAGSGGTGGSGGGGNGGATPAPTYTVTYVDGVDDAVITVPSDTNQYHEGDTVTVQFTGIGNRDYYGFSGWSEGTATYTSSGTTTFTMGTANVTLTAQWSGPYIGTKIPSAAKEVYDIVFNDGSAMPYVTFDGLDETTKNAKKTSAIAMIFYKGERANNGGDTTTIRTLGIGLKESDTGIAWCTNSAKAYNKDITTIRRSDKNGSDNLEQIAAFLNEAHLSNESVVNDTGVGENNTKTPEEAAELYPAFWFAKNYKNQIIGSETASRILEGSEFATGWYLPSETEFHFFYSSAGYYIVDNKMISDAIAELGGNVPISRPDSHCYWVSTQYTSNSNGTDKDHAVYYRDYDRFEHWSKTNPNRACAIREFN